MIWIPVFESKLKRYDEGVARLSVGDERALVRLGNVAYAAALALLMAGDRDSASVWFERAAMRWRESWDAGAADDAWGRPIGALKAALIAEDGPRAEELADWALEIGAGRANSVVGRYAAVLALLVLGRSGDALPIAQSLRGREDFPPPVAEALAAISADDVGSYADAIESVVTSFETRTDFLEDVPVADTALALARLAARRGIDVPLRGSPVLPLA